VGRAKGGREVKRKGHRSFFSFFFEGAERSGAEQSLCLSLGVTQHICLAPCLRACESHGRRARRRRRLLSMCAFFLFDGRSCSRPQAHLEGQHDGGHPRVCVCDDGRVRSVHDGGWDTGRGGRPGSQRERTQKKKKELLHMHCPPIPHLLSPSPYSRPSLCAPLPFSPPHSLHPPHSHLPPKHRLPPCRFQARR